MMNDRAQGAWARTDPLGSEHLARYLFQAPDEAAKAAETPIASGVARIGPSRGITGHQGGPLPLRSVSLPRSGGCHQQAGRAVHSTFSTPT